MPIAHASRTEKLFVWPLYAAAVRARWKVPACVLVITPHAKVAAWVRTPIATGQPGSPTNGQGRADGLTEGKAEGKGEGKAEALLGVLSARGLPLSDGLRAKILACRDPSVLERWITLAVTAASAEEALR
jgi:hypothetical protein